MVEPCRETPILVDLDKSLEVDEWLSKSGSRINNLMFTYAPYGSYVTVAKEIVQEKQPVKLENDSAQKTQMYWYMYTGLLCDITGRK